MNIKNALDSKLLKIINPNGEILHSKQRNYLLSDF